MVTKHCDVAVVGAGPAGIAAAICSARAGCRTVLVERNGFPGGMVVKGAISTLCGLYLHTGAVPRFIYDGFTAEFIRRLMKTDRVAGPLRMGKLHVLPFRPDSFQGLAGVLIDGQREVQAFFSAELTGVAVNRTRIERLAIRAGGKSWEMETGVVIDCSGNAAVARLAGLNVMTGDPARQSPAVMVPVGNVTGALSSPARRIQILLALQRAAMAGNLPKEAATVAFMPSLDEDTVVLKLNPGAAAADPDNSGSGRRAAAALLAYLQAHVAEFARSSVMGESFPLLQRTSHRLVGRYVLKGGDVLRAAIFPDAVAQGCWPMEQWDAEGRQRLRYLPSGECYDIPSGALQAVGLENLFMAGKTISADEDAIASARVIGCCLATGEAAGRLAAAACL
ncbi:MAG: FAD-dependent oxidoreductase [Thermodesulfobacteriota bacterium]